MTPMTEAAAEKLAPDQATAVVRVLDLQAGWDALLADKTAELAGLHARQKAHDAYQLALREYAGAYRGAPIPEPAHGIPDRLAAWCRVLRAVFGQATGGAPVRVVEKVYRLADRIAARLKAEPVAREPLGSMADAVRALDAVIAWCDAGGGVPKAA
jgi:hypothetical protein